MRILIAGMAALAVLVLPATAETRYDRKIDQAAADIVAAKLGELRGGLAFDVRPPVRKEQVIDLRTTGSIGASPAMTVRPLALAPAAAQMPARILPSIGRRVVRVIF